MTSGKDRFSRFQNVMHDAALSRPIARYSDKVKVGNWLENRVHRHYQGDILANIQPITYDWDIAGKVGSCQDSIRKKECQEKVLDQLESSDYNVPEPCVAPCPAPGETCIPADTCFKAGPGNGSELRPQRLRYTPYSELDDPRWNLVFDKDDIDNSTGMRTNFERDNHRIYEGCEPSFKVPRVCQHKRDFFPVNVNWGLGYEHRKKIAQLNCLDKNRWVTIYREAYGPEEMRHIQPHPYVDPPDLPKQRPLICYRRAELGEQAEVPLSPTAQMRPPRVTP